MPEQEIYVELELVILTTKNRKKLATNFLRKIIVMITEIIVQIVANDFAVACGRF